MAYTLTLGSNGLDVQKAQYYINQIIGQPNLQALVEDGVYGQKTEFGVAVFQYVYGLPVDGVLGNTTWNRMVQEFKSISKPGPEKATMRRNLSVGSSGLGVQKIQEYLNRLISPNPPLATDGRFGSGTRQAVMTFQATHGLKVDGIVGSDTWNRIIQLI